MKRLVVLGACLWPAIAFAQQTYTNADLVKFNVPGAYTNDDLRQLSPLAIQKTPAAVLPLFSIPPVFSGPFQSSYDMLRGTRTALQTERDFELARVAESESPSGGDSQGFTPRLGYATKVRPLIMELEKRIALIDHQIDDLRDAARRAGASIDLR